MPSPFRPPPEQAGSLALLCLARTHVVVCCLLIAMLAYGAQAAENGGMERSVKAAFLYKFLSYVEYPPPTMASDAAYVIGVVNAEEVAAELSRLTEGRNVNSHPIQVKTIRIGDSVAGLHVLFIGAGDSSHAAAWLRAAQQASVLSVTELAEPSAAASIINFRVIDSRVRFVVSLDAAEKSNLKLSSRLLSVAYAVLRSGA